jgi:hypothetical protein
MACAKTITDTKPRIRAVVRPGLSWMSLNATVSGLTIIAKLLFLAPRKTTAKGPICERLRTPAGRPRCCRRTPLGRTGEFETETAKMLMEGAPNHTEHLESYKRYALAKPFEAMAVAAGAAFIFGALWGVRRR